jgi:uncharacterized membrane protein YjjP (DUF1212 family)
MAGFGPLDNQHTFLIRVQPGELNLGRLSALDEVAHLVVAGKLSPGIITLLPGLTVTVAMTELASRHLSSGSVRLSAAFIVFASMAFGVALGTTVVTELHGGPVHAAAATALPAWARSRLDWRPASPRR